MKRDKLISKIIKGCLDSIEENLQAIKTYEDVLTVGEINLLSRLISSHDLWKKLLKKDEDKH